MLRAPRTSPAHNLIWRIDNNITPTLHATVLPRWRRPLTAPPPVTSSHKVHSCPELVRAKFTVRERKKFCRDKVTV